MKNPLLPTHRNAWLAFSAIAFAGAWLLRIPIEEPQAKFWELWPMLITHPGERIDVGILLAIVTVALGATAMGAGWVLQLLWSSLLGAYGPRGPLLVRVMRSPA